jgi:hypothetical protein
MRPEDPVEWSWLAAFTLHWKLEFNLFQRQGEVEDTALGLNDLSQALGSVVRLEFEKWLDVREK